HEVLQAGGTSCWCQRARPRAPGAEARPALRRAVHCAQACQGPLVCSGFSGGNVRASSSEYRFSAEM
ncbi:hypothetical protein CSUI_005504, partial [Cystoisospora suis]